MSSTEQAKPPTTNSVAFTSTSCHRRHDPFFFLDTPPQSRHHHHHQHHHHQHHHHQHHHHQQQLRELQPVEYQLTAQHHRMRTDYNHHHHHHHHHRHRHQRDTPQETQICQHPKYNNKQDQPKQQHQKQHQPSLRERRIMKLKRIAPTHSLSIHATPPDDEQQPSPQQPQQPHQPPPQQPQQLQQRHRRPRNLIHSEVPACELHQNSDSTTTSTATTRETGQQQQLLTSQNVPIKKSFIPDQQQRTSSVILQQHKIQPRTPSSPPQHTQKQPMLQRQKSQQQQLDQLPHQSSTMNFKLSYVDFPPRCAGAGNIICAPEYERFDSLLARANEWLAGNPHLKVKTCESIEVKGRYDGIVDTCKSCYFEADHSKRRMRNLYIRALRLWIIPKDEDDPLDPQQIGYVNVVPARNSIGTFDTFGEAVQKFNKHLRSHSLPGRIITIESQEMKFHEWGLGVDPDESCWVESVKFNLSFLVVIRVFFQLGSPAYEEIGCADFVPSNLDPGSQFTVPRFETFEQVFQKSSAWLRHQKDIRVTNIQSIDYKLKDDTSSDELDTQRSFYVESGRYTTKYLRIVRICFTRPFSPASREGDNYDDVNFCSSSSSQSYFSDSDEDVLSQGCEFCSPPSDRLQEQGTAFESSRMKSSACRCCRPCSLPRLNSFSTSQDASHQSADTMGRSRSREGRGLLVHSHSLNFGQRRTFSGVQEAHQRQRSRSAGRCLEPVFPNYVTFEPVMLSSGGIIGIPLFERLSETMKRAMLWLGKCNPNLKVISAETVPVRIFSGNQYGNHEVTYTWNRGEQKEFWLFVLRLYLSGDFELAPPDILLPSFLVKKHNEHCCSVM